MTPSAGPSSASSETSSPGVPVERARAADDVDPRRRRRSASTCDARVPLRGEEQQRRELVVEPAAVARRARGCARAPSRPPRRARARGRSRPSPPDGARSATPALSAAATASGEAESKSPTASVTSRPSASACSSPLSAATTGAPSGDAERAADAAALRPTPPPRSLPTRLPPLALPRSGSAGRRRVRPPSQPGCPSSPLRLGHRSDGYARAVTSSAADPAEHRPSRALPRHALGRPAARSRRGHDHARPRDRDRVDPRPRAGDLPDRRGARGAARWPADGSLRPRPRHRRAGSSSGSWAAC